VKTVLRRLAVGAIDLLCWFFLTGAGILLNLAARLEDGTR
jgi:hypothetical protein